MGLIPIKTAQEAREIAQNLGPLGPEIKRLWNEIAGKIQEAQASPCAIPFVAGFSESAEVSIIVAHRLKSLGYLVRLQAEPVLGPLEPSHSDKPRTQFVRVTVDWSGP